MFNKGSVTDVGDKLGKDTMEKSAAVIKSSTSSVTTFKWPGLGSSNDLLTEEDSSTTNDSPDKRGDGFSVSSPADFLRLGLDRPLRRFETPDILLVRTNLPCIDDGDFGGRY